MVVRHGFLTVKVGPDGVHEPTSHNQAEKNRVSRPDNLWQEEHRLPTHGQIDDQAQFGNLVLAQNLVKNTTDNQEPLEGHHDPALPFAQRHEQDWRVGTRNGDEDAGVVQNPEDPLVGRIVGHAVIEGGGEEHEAEGHHKDASPCRQNHPALLVGVNGRPRGQAQQNQEHDAMADGIGQFLAEGEFKGWFHGELAFVFFLF